MDDARRWTAPFWLERLAGWSWRLLVIAVAVGGFFGAVAALEVVVLPMFVALLLTAGCSPLQRRLLRAGAKPGLAAAVCTVSILLVGVVVVLVAVQAILSQSDEIGAAIDAAIERLQQESVDAGIVDPDDAAQTAGEWRDGVESLLRFVATGLVSLVSTVVGLVTQAFVAVFVTFFLLKDGPVMWRWFLERTGVHRTVFDRAGRQGFDAIAGYVRGAALVAAVDAVLIGGGAFLLGVPFASAIAVLTLVLSFVPIVGAIIAGAFATLLAVADGGIGTGLAMLAIVLVVQQVESNLLQPMVLSKATRLHPLVVFLAVIAGGGLAGFIGIVAAVPVTAALVAVGAVLRQEGLFSDRPRAVLPTGPAALPSADPAAGTAEG